MDDTLSIMEDLLLLIRAEGEVDEANFRCNINNLIDRISDIRKQQEQDCLQEAEAYFQ